MTIRAFYAMGYRDDKPEGRFHDIIEVEKANSYASAAILYAADNPGLAE